MLVKSKNVANIYINLFHQAKKKSLLWELNMFLDMDTSMYAWLIFIFLQACAYSGTFVLWTPWDGPNVSKYHDFQVIFFICMAKSNLGS